ncbi:MAG: hypothetical protein M1G31_08010 [Pseudanabaena sp. Salubria-1]|nr:hypothetical protein [Pseudanabaena sp. Salubria-1]
MSRSLLFLVIREDEAIALDNELEAEKLGSIIKCCKPITAKIVIKNRASLRQIIPR